MLARVLTSNLGRVLGTLLVIGVAGSTVSYGTFASFTAQTSNTGNTFSTGSLVLGNRTAQAGTTCLSTGSAGLVAANSNDCGTYIVAAGATGAGLAPGGAVVTGQVAIYNSGTLPINSLKLYANACGTGNNPNVTDPNQIGTGNLCPKVNISVFEEGATCVIPVSGTCTAVSTPTSTVTLATFPTSPLEIKTNMLSGAVATYTFAIQIDGSADNSVMGRQATTTFHWFAQ